MPVLSRHSQAVLQALFVTVLWSSSWILIKLGLKGLPPLSFAGLRYFLGFLILFPLLSPADRKAIRHLSRRQWMELLVLGFVMYFLTQGSQFLSLLHFPAVLPALLLNLTPVVVGLVSALVLNERPRRQQILGIGVCLIGASLYFVPRLQSDVALTWLLLIPVFGMLANAGASVLGRAVNRREHLSPKAITVISMGIGSLMLLATGVTLEPMPSISGAQWLIVLWLASVNTAFAFTLWNHTLRTLTSVESSVINNTMMIQIAALAWVVLGERLEPMEVGALAFTTLGALLVQLRKK